MIKNWTIRLRQKPNYCLILTDYMRFAYIHLNNCNMHAFSCADPANDAVVC